jgi:hypothetical protein
VPKVVREKLAEDGAEAMTQMLTDAGALSEERQDRRLAEEIGKVRLDLAELRVELLRWSFLFWIGQMTGMTALLALAVGIILKFLGGPAPPPG